MLFNRLANVGNRFQGDYRKVLCVCSAGLLRSPTAAVVLSSSPFDYNTRAAGCVPEYALVPVDEALIAWADEIVCMEQRHLEILAASFDVSTTPTKVLDISDNFRYRDPVLMQLIADKYRALG